MQTDASNVTLPGLFANKCFRIPNYQRGYAWGESQLNDLWDDIMDIQKNGATYRPHYTGAITLQQIDVNDLTSQLQKKLKDSQNLRIHVYQTAVARWSGESNEENKIQSDIDNSG